MKYDPNAMKKRRILNAWFGSSCGIMLNINPLTYYNISNYIYFNRLIDNKNRVFITEIIRK